MFIGELIWNHSLRSVVTSRIVELSASESRIRTVVDNVIEGIMTVDRHSMIRDVNAASLDLFKAETNGFIGRHIGELAVASGGMARCIRLLPSSKAAPALIGAYSGPITGRMISMKRAEPPIPQSYAVVGTQVAIGNMNQ